MALDEESQHVVVAFRSPARLAVFSARDGARVANVEMCGDADDVFIDAKRHRAYVSCGDGFLDIFDTSAAPIAGWHITRRSPAPVRRCSCRNSIDCSLRCALAQVSPRPSGYTDLSHEKWRCSRWCDHNDRSSTATRRRIPRVGIGASLLAMAVIAWSGQALAYRPFDGTDAAVAEPGEMEIELQPVGVPWIVSNNTDRARHGDQLRLRQELGSHIAGTGRNAALAPWSKQFVADRGVPEACPRTGKSSGQAGAERRNRVRCSLARYARRFRIWCECGRDCLATLGLGAIHFNAAATLTREQHADVFVGGILEGPAKWTVRPVAELFYEEELGHSHTVSALIGAIWQVRDNLSFDVGLRHAQINDHSVNEVRLGMTFGFPLRFTEVMDHNRPR